MPIRTKLTPFVRKKLGEYIEMGVPIGRAAVAVGIAHQTFNRWLRRGENADNGDDGIYVQLVQEIERAEANFIKRNVERIDKGADKNPEDAKWLLERRDPFDFAKRVELEVGPSKVLLAMQEQARKRLSEPEVKEIETTALLSVCDSVDIGGDGV